MSEEVKLAKFNIDYMLSEMKTVHSALTMKHTIMCT